jgi:hypothetical protein
MRGRTDKISRDRAASPLWSCGGRHNLFHGDKYKWSLRSTAINVTKKVALYNFFSTASVLAKSDKPATSKPRMYPWCVTVASLTHYAGS